MFIVRSSPCPAPNLQSNPPLHAACTAVARRLPPPSPHVVPHRMPSFRLSAARVCVQPAAELRHLQRHEHGQHVLRALLLPVPCSRNCSRALPPARCLRRRRPPPPALPHLALHHMPSLRLGRAQTPCPTPTSCSSIARGRAPRPSTLTLAMARGAGLREAARQTEALYIKACVTG